MTILVSILVLGILIFVHELGHFLLAKINNIGVFEFSIGFGKKLWRRRIGDTYYALGAIPLGGYVSMAGDDPALLERKAEKSVEENETEAATPEDPLAKKLLENEETWFLKKSYLPKLSVVLAGPLFNYFFAIILAVISFMTFGAMKPVSDPVIGDVMPGFAAEKAGILPNDRVLSINGIKMENWEQLADSISVSKGEEMDFYIERTKPERDNDSPAQKENLNLKVRASLDFEELAAVQGEKNDRYRIGISQSFKREKVGVFEAMSDGTSHVWGITVMTLRGIKGMIQGAISPKHIAGPIFIFSTAAKSAKRGMEYLIGFVIFLSVSLAILNLLPIPVLDGGHILFFTIEAIIGRPLSLKVQQVATQIGVAFLLLLTLFAVSNDIRRLFEDFVV